MALIAKDTAPQDRPPWRGLVVGLVAALMFILVLAISAWLTRDTPRGVPPHAEDAGFPDAGFPDGGPDEAVADAGLVLGPDGGVVDAGTLEGPATEPDSGPIHVDDAPVKPAEVAALVAPVVEECLKAALRFDPALGGKAEARAVAARGGLSVTMPAAPSPVLGTCVADKGKLPYANAPVEPAVVLVKLRLDGLRGTVSVVAADVVVGSGDTPPLP